MLDTQELTGASVAARSKKNTKTGRRFFLLLLFFFLFLVLLFSRLGLCLCIFCSWGGLFWWPVLFFSPALLNINLLV